MSEQIKVLHVVFSLDPGGLENGVVNVANTLPATQFQVDVCCLEARGEFADRLPKQSRVAVLDKKPGKSISTIWKLNRLIREWRPDVVHSHNLGPLIYATWATLGGRSCSILHGEHGQLPPEELSTKRLRQRRKYYESCKFVHTVSDALRDQILALSLAPEEKIISLRNGVDTERFCPNKRSECRSEFGFSDDMVVIGSVGRIVASKRHDDLMDAFDNINDPSTILLIAGDGECLEELRVKRNSLQSKERILLTGHCSNPEQIYNAIDLFVLPSEIEGLSNALLEAMATGLPCLVNDACGNNDVITMDENGLIMTMATTSELGEALRIALEKKGAWLKLGEAARTSVEQSFSIESMAKRYADLYRLTTEGKV